MKLSNTATKYAAAGALVLAGFGVGAVLASNGTAGAATGALSSAVTGGTSDADGDGHGDGAGHRAGNAGETPLTGDTATKVKAAALANYPGGTIDRLETDSDGVYEAHIVTAGGSELIVQVGKDFKITGTQTGGGADHDGDGPDASTSDSSTDS